MTIVQAIVLGLVQGLTEFIPISSTAHLRIVPALLGWEDPGAAASAVIQIGTLIAVLIYFRAEVARMAVAFTRGLVSGHPFDHEDSRLAWYLIAGTVPICVFGLAFQHLISTTLRGMWIIASALVGLAFVLLAAEAFVRRAGILRPIESLGFRDALLIGLGQALALIPGVSRSGATITTALFRRFNHEAAARFSFFLSIPAIALSGFYELIKEHEHLAQLGWPSIAIATLAAFLSGWSSIWFLLRYLRTHTTAVFIVYRIVLGTSLLVWLASGRTL